MRRSRRSPVEPLEGHARLVGRALLDKGGGLGVTVDHVAGDGGEGAAAVAPQGRS